jgi:hypothetical protein
MDIFDEDMIPKTHEKPHRHKRERERLLSKAVYTPLLGKERERVEDPKWAADD